MNLTATALPSLASVVLPSTSSASRPLKILFVLTSMPVGGAETLLVNLIDRLDPARCLAEIVCLKSPGVLGEQLVERLPVHSNLLTHKWDLRILPKLTKLFRERQADAVITVGSGDKMFWGRLAAKRAKVPVVCSALHSTGWPDGINWMNRCLTPWTDAFIAVAESHAQFLRQQERLGEDRVVTIRNGVDTDRFIPCLAARDEVRRELGLSLDTPLVGIVAALRPEKNHGLFVEMAAAVRDQVPNAHFVIVGDGPMRDAITAQCEERNVKSIVHLLGTRYDTPRLLAALDVFTLCSHNEASPVSILEALSCGVPVVSTAVGSIGETVLQGTTGFLVSPGDLGAMTNEVVRLLRTPLLAQQLGYQGRALVQQTGSLAAMVEGYQNLIERLYRR